MVWSKWDLGWPWMGLGAALVILVLMFATDVMRSRTAVSRWWDPVWLSWLAVPMYLLHIFEEYSHDVLGRVYFIVGGVCAAQGYPPYPDCPIPTLHYPLVNIALVWVAAPIAAYLSRRNIVIGLTFFGFILFNGVFHIVTVLLQGSDAYPGVVTGILLFVPISLWVIYVCLKSGVMNAKALAVSYAGGIAGHLGLVLTYSIFNATGSPAAMFAADIGCVSLPFLVAGLGSKLLGAQATTRALGAR
ncbi:MAG TPA: HXXEE domain-containing protein [Caldimonas sp.]|jgi:hypothetical protein